MTLARFWWGASSSERKIHWLSWEKLCLPKKMGGMGFRDLGIFNQALLAKQGWRLLQNPDSLAHRVLKARYFKSGDFLTANRGFDPSYVWRSIWGARALLADGLMWRVGNGQHIKVWDDAWLPSGSGHTSPTPNLESDANMVVGDFINHDHHSWDIERMRLHLVEEDVLRAASLPLSVKGAGDSQFWAHTKDGIYTTKSGYWFGRLGHLRDWELRYGSGQAELWSSIWSLDGPPKLRNFLWRACSGSLATMGKLSQRHIQPQGTCSLCEGEEESIIHAIFQCNVVKQVWDNSQFAELLVDAPSNSFEARWVWVCAKLTAEELRCFAAIAWAAWAIRNAAVFAEPWQMIEVGVAGLVKLVEDYRSYAKAVGGARTANGLRTFDRWGPPPSNCVRINTDAAIFNDGEIGLGVVLRDSQGKLLAVSTQRHLSSGDVFLAEAMAARHGLEVALRLGYRRIELQCDASEVVNAIRNERRGLAPIDLILFDLFAFSREFDFFECIHVRRAGNCVAHLAARSCPSGSFELLYTSSFPQGLIELAEFDLI